MTSPLKRQSFFVIYFFIMSLDNTQFVSSNFAEFLLDNANDGNEILAVLDDIAEGANTPL
jgi:hypothetical protein